MVFMLCCSRALHEHADGGMCKQANFHISQSCSVQAAIVWCSEAFASLPLDLPAYLLFAQTASFVFSLLVHDWVNLYSS